MIEKNKIEALLDKKFIKVFDLQYREGKHYFDATRRSIDDLAAVKTDDEFRQMLPDAVTCIVVVKTPEEEPRLLLAYEYRYPAGRYLLSPPAGLIDAEDKLLDQPLINAAKREIREETGISVGEDDPIYVVNPCLFSSPGFTDESNALVCAEVTLPDLSSLTQEGAVGSESFDGFLLLTKKEAEEVLKAGRDKVGFYYSVYTWCALAWFAGDF